MFGRKKEKRDNVKNIKGNEAFKKILDLSDDLREASAENEKLKQKNEEMEKALLASRGCVKGEWCETCENASHAPGSWGLPGKLICSANPKCEHYVKKQTEAVQ